MTFPRSARSLFASASHSALAVEDGAAGEGGGEPAAGSDPAAARAADEAALDAALDKVFETGSAAEPPAPKTDDGKAEDGAADGQPPAEDEAKAAPAPQTDAAAAPPSPWAQDTSGEDRALLDGLADDARAAVARQLEGLRGQAEAAVAEAGAGYQELDGVLAPHREAMAAAGSTPAQVMGLVLNSLARAQDPAQVPAVIAEIAAMHADPAAVLGGAARALGIGAGGGEDDTGDAEGAGGDGAGARDPRVAHLLGQVRDLSQQVQGLTNAHVGDRKAAALSEVQAFLAETDEAGQPRHPHAEAKVDALRAELAVVRAATPGKPIREQLRLAYERLERTDPELATAREKRLVETATRKAEAERNRLTEAERKAAAAHVEGSGAPGEARPKSREAALDADLDKVYDAGMG